MCIVFSPNQPIAVCWFSYPVVDITQWLNENIAIGVLHVVALAKIQYTCDDEPTISCINQDKNIDNEVYYICIKFPQQIVEDIYCQIL